jgi:hypothetical protein
MNKLNSNKFAHGLAEGIELIAASSPDFECLILVSSQAFVGSKFVML